MKPATIAVATLIAFLFLNAELQAQTDQTDATTADGSAIGQTMVAFMNAWNVHDAHALALTFTPDADFTNVLGAHAHGRAGVESFHAPVFATIFKNSHLTGAIRSVRLLKAQLAAVDVDWQMTGAEIPGASPVAVRRGLLDWIMQRQSDGSWLIEVMHNTNLPPVNTTPPK
jgi:uncharacterized protein (TIGR02246 family)